MYRRRTTEECDGDDSAIPWTLDCMACKFAYTYLCTIEIRVMYALETREREREIDYNLGRNKFLYYFLHKTKEFFYTALSSV